MSVIEKEKLIQVKLKPRQEERILAGHLWIFSNEIAEVSQKGEPGALVKVVASSGAPVGIGFYNPASLIACRMLSRTEEAVDKNFFKRRLEAALKYRQRACPEESSYRLCFGESDGLPGLVIDRYGNFFVLQILSAGMEKSLPLIQGALEDLFSPGGIYLKNDHRSRALEGLAAECRVLSGEVPEQVEIVEGGLKFLTPLTSGQKTGFYFDQRDNRAFLRPYFKGRVVLDLYSYTGAFALNAARAGAASVYGLDSSAAAVALARENASLNNLPARFDEGDAQDALEAFVTGPEDNRPDMILLDPPSFVPSKKHLPKALKSYAKLNAQALRALKPGGLLATSTCSHHVSREIFIDMLRQAQGRAKKDVKLLALRGQAADHPILLAMPETEYLHFALLEVA